jgi:hypothetical protein
MEYMFDYVIYCVWLLGMKLNHMRIRKKNITCFPWWEVSAWTNKKELDFVDLVAMKIGLSCVKWNV